jgi:cystathionine beta-lyase
MAYDFDTLVDRRCSGSMKEQLNTPALRDRGLIAFSGAEMDFKTAPVIVEALQRFAERGIYGYTLPDKPYLQAVRWWMKAARGLDVEECEIVPALGTMFALGTAIRAFTEPGDGILLMHPVYYRFDVRASANARRVVSVPLIERRGAYEIDFQALESAAADPRNKLLVVCNPHNPLGKVFSRDDLTRIAALAKAHGLLVFSDEIFGELGYSGHEVTPYLNVDPENGILCTSLGKAFNFTGVNHANMLIKNPALRERFLAQRHRDHFGSIDPFFYQAVLAGYSSEGLGWVNAMKAYVRENYLLIQSAFAERMPYLKLSPLEGGFVAWIDFRALGLAPEPLQAFLEDEAHLYLDPGAEYGPEGEGFCRMNIASPRRYIERAMECLASACKARNFSAGGQ